jgi:hypothetical protein
MHGTSRSFNDSVQVRMRTLLVFDAVFYSVFYAVFVLCLALVSLSLISSHFASLGAGITHHYFCSVLPSQVFIKLVLHVWSFCLFIHVFCPVFRATSCIQLRVDLHACHSFSSCLTFFFYFFFTFYFLLRLPTFAMPAHAHSSGPCSSWRNFNRRPKCVHRLHALRSTWLSLWAQPQRQSLMTCEFFVCLCVCVFYKFRYLIDEHLTYMCVCNKFESFRMNVGCIDSCR